MNVDSVTKSATHTPPAWLVCAVLVVPPILSPSPGFEPAYKTLVQVILAALCAGMSLAMLSTNPAVLGLTIGAILSSIASVLSNANFSASASYSAIQTLHFTGVLFACGGFLNWAIQVPTPLLIPVQIGSAPGAPMVNLGTQGAAMAGAEIPAPGARTEAPPVPARGQPAEPAPSADVEELRKDLKYLEELEHILIKTVPSMVILMSENLKIRMVNRQFKEFFKLVPDEEVGQDIDKLIPNKDLLKSLKEATGKAGVREFDFEHYVKKSGEKKFAARISGEQQGMVILVMDEKKAQSDASRLPKTQIINLQSEKLALAGGVLDDMIGSMGPLIQTLASEAEILTSRKDVGQESKDVATAIRGKAQTLARILKTFQSFAEKHLERPEELSLVTVVEEALDPKNYAFDISKIEISKDIGLFRPKVEANKKQLLQGLVNILTNAFEAIQRAKRPGIVEVRVAEDAGKAVIDIADNGIGMNQDELKKALRGEFSAKHVGSGGGMGLGVAQKVLYGVHGNLLAQSSEGEGTVFTLQIPTTNK